MTTAHQYNNPFDISLKQSQLDAYPGAYINPIQGQPGFVAFPTYDMGVQAFSDRLDRAFSGGNPSGTIAEMNTWYARDQNWQNNVSSASGIGVNTPLDPSNIDQKNALAYGIVSAEHGRGSANEIFGGAPGSSGFNNVLGGSGGASAHPLLKQMGFSGKASADKNSLDPTPSAQQKDQMKSPASATSQDLFNGAPVYLTDPHGVASEAGKSVQEGAQKAGQDIQQGLGTTADAITGASQEAHGITQYFGNLFYNLLPRLGLITMGIVLIGGAFVIMGFEQAKKSV